MIGSDSIKKRLFVAMPYGSREGQLDPEAVRSKPLLIKFDDVWKGILKPAIPASFECKRADELRKPGLIDQLYNEWLFGADVVLADLTFGNANVFYELGIRQALSKRGTVLVAHVATKLPFDVRNQLVLNYDAFDAASVLKFQSELRESIENAASHEIDSPVHVYLPGLYVKRYRNGEDPDATIDLLRREILELKERIAREDMGALGERIYRQVIDTVDAKRLVALFSLIINADGFGIHVLQELGVRLRRVGRFNESLAVFRKAEKATANDSTILRELGFVHRKLGHFDEAERYFTAALVQNAGDPELQGMVGGLLKRKGLFEEALARYELMNRLFEDDLYAIVNLGALNALLHRFTEAARFYRKLVQLCETKITNSSADHWTYLCLGEAEVYFGASDRAHKAFRDALQLRPPVEDVRSAAEQLGMFVRFNVEGDLAKDVLHSVLEPFLAIS